MKNIIIILIVFFSISEAKSQPFRSIFGSSSTAWNTKQTQLLVSSSDDYTDSLFYVADTIINSQLFKKFNLVQIYPNGQVLPVDYYNGFIKEDTLTGRAWYFSDADTNLRLIMDMSLQLNDSFMVRNDWSSTIYASYYLVDSICYVSGKKHIRLNYIFQFIPNNQSINEKFLMIEGVGTNLGVKYMDLNLTAYAPYLLCQHKNATFYYGNANPYYVNNCSILTADKEKFENNKDFKIFPNPTNHEICIDANNIENISGVSICAVQGMQIISFNSFVKCIDVSQLNNGLYFISILQKNGRTQTFKFIKI